MSSFWERSLIKLIAFGSRPWIASANFERVLHAGVPIVPSFCGEHQIFASVPQRVPICSNLSVQTGVFCSTLNSESSDRTTTSSTGNLDSLGIEKEHQFREIPRFDRLVCNKLAGLWLVIAVLIEYAVITGHFRQIIECCVPLMYVYILYLHTCNGGNKFDVCFGKVTDWIRIKLSVHTV